MKADQSSSVGRETELPSTRASWGKAHQIVTAVLIVLSLPNIVGFLRNLNWLPERLSELVDAGGWWFGATGFFAAIGCLLWGILNLRSRSGVAVACILFGLFCLTFMQLLPGGR